MAATDGPTSSAVVIRGSVLLIWLVVVGAVFDVGRCYELVVEGWEALASLLAILIGGNTVKRVQEIRSAPALVVAEK